MQESNFTRTFGKGGRTSRSIKFQIVSKHKVLVLSYLFFNVLLSILIVLSILFREKFIDSLMLDQQLEKVMFLLIANLFLMFFIRYGFPALKDLIDTVMTEKIRISTDYEMMQKKSKISYYLHEDPEMANKFEVSKEASNQIWVYWKSIFSILSDILSLIGIFLLLSRLGIFVVIVLIFLFVPIFYFSIKAGNKYIDVWGKTSEMRRQCDYQKKVMLDKEYSKEKILFGHTSFFKKQWEGGYLRVRSVSIKEELRGAKNLQIVGLLFVLYIAVLMIILIVQLDNNLVTAGFVVSVISIVPSHISKSIDSISNNINSMVRAKGLMDTLDEVLEFDEEDGVLDLPERDVDFTKIELRNVSFKYPGTSEWIIKGLNMSIEQGKHYAIVGENGAGKSTIIKLLLRLYHVTEGEILVDGKNLDSLKSSEIKGLVSALFQDFQKYYTTVSENIGLGDIHNIDDMQLITRNAGKAKVSERIEKLSNSYQSVLGTINEDGVELSGGEWQKLCIARLLMSPCPIKILDEPTASMDPVFENELYKDFLSIMQDRTTISISHRLSSCKNTDFIYVISEGSVIEKGTHSDLMMLGGIYQKMYSTQQSVYK